MAKKEKKKSASKKLPAEDIARARATAAGLEASFTEPPPPGALAPAPFFDEIRELGEAGRAGMLEHLAATPPEGRAAALRSIRALGDPALVPGLMKHARGRKWPAPDLEILCETILALDPSVKLPADLSPENFSRLRMVAERFSADGDLDPRVLEEMADAFSELPPPLRESALHGVISEGQKKDGPGGGQGEKFMALAEMLAAKGVSPPSVLIDALGALATPEAGAVLLEFSRTVQEKEAGSRVRKAIYRLRESGVLPQEEKKKNTQWLASAAPEMDAMQAFASAADGRGRHFVWLVRSRQPRGRYLFQARLCAGKGIEEFLSLDMTAKEVREVIGRFSSEQNFPIAEVPIPYGCWLIERARRAHAAAGTPAPRGFTHSTLLLAPLMETMDLPERPHPVHALLPDGPADALRMKPDDIFSQAPFWTWVLEGDAVMEQFKKFLEGANSQVTIDEEQRRTRLRQIVEESAGVLYQDAPLRERLAAQLEDNAYVFHQRKSGELAGECLALAGEFQAEEKPAAFFVEMVNFTMSMLLNRMIQENQAESAKRQAGAAPQASDEGSEAAAGEGEPLIVTP